MPLKSLLTPLPDVLKTVVVITAAQRRWSGAVLGVLLGLAYGIVSQYINTWVQPALNYYQPPFGAVGNIILFSLLGMSIGLVTCLSVSTANGVIYGSIMAAAILLFTAYVTGNQVSETLFGKILITFFIFFPIAGACLPLIWLFRWAVNEQGEEIERFFLHPRRAWAPLLLVTAMAALGLTNLYRPEARTLMLKTDAMIQSALQAGNPASLPIPLQPNDVVNFHQQAGDGSHTIQWIKEPINIYAIPSVATPDYEKSVVIIRFNNGWNIVCLYPDDEFQPECRGYDQLNTQPYIPQTP